MKTRITWLWDVHYLLKGAPFPEGSIKVASDGNQEAMKTAKKILSKSLLKVKASRIEMTAAINIGTVVVS